MDAMSRSCGLKFTIHMDHTFNTIKPTYPSTYRQPHKCFQWAINIAPILMKYRKMSSPG